MIKVCFNAGFSATWYGDKDQKQRCDHTAENTQRKRVHHGLGVNTYALYQRAALGYLSRKLAPMIETLKTHGYTEKPPQASALRVHGDAGDLTRFLR